MSTHTPDERIRARYPHESPERSAFDTDAAFNEAWLLYCQGQSELTEGFFQAIPFPAVSTLHNGTIVYANSQAQALFGLTPSDLMRHRVHEYLFDADENRIGMSIGARVSEGDVIHHEAVYVKRPDGRQELRMLSVAPVFAQGTRTLIRVIGFFLDPQASERESESLRSLNRELSDLLLRKTEEADRYRVMAYTDDLTGLPNQRAFWEQIRVAVEHERRRNGSIAFFYFDTDDFKEVNDRFGHRTGDNLLRDVANRVRAVTEQHEGFCARMSGDEFAAYFQAVHANRYQEIADAFSGMMSFAFVGYEKGSRSPVTLEITVSIGATHRVSGGIIPEPGDLLGEADDAMYESKMSGTGLDKKRPHVLRPAPPPLSSRPPRA